MPMEYTELSIKMNNAVYKQRSLENFHPSQEEF